MYNGNFIGAELCWASSLIVHASRSAMKLSSVFLRQQIWCLGNFLSFDSLTNFIFKWIWWVSESSYDYFYLWGV